jgi:glutaredoxin
MDKNTNTNKNTNKNTETVEFILPSVLEYTIYSKSGCPNCKKVKELLETTKISFELINCDEYLLENKEAFLEFIMKLTRMEWKTFPMVFDKGQFIGGFIDTKIYLGKMLEFTDDF